MVVYVDPLGNSVSSPYDPLKPLEQAPKTQILQPKPY